MFFFTHVNRTLTEAHDLNITTDNYYHDQYKSLRRLQPRDRQKSIIKAKQNWHKRRQNASQRRRKQRQDKIEQQEKLQNTDPTAVIPSEGTDGLGFRLLNAASFDPVTDINGDLITLGRGRSGKVDLYRHRDSGYMVAAKTMMKETSER